MAKSAIPDQVYPFFPLLPPSSDIARTRPPLSRRVSLQQFTGPNDPYPVTDPLVNAIDVSDRSQAFFKFLRP